MGGRYLITGTQIGMLKAMTRNPDAIATLNEILEKQFVFDNDGQTHIEQDTLKIRQMMGAKNELRELPP